MCCLGCYCYNRRRRLLSDRCVKAEDSETAEDSNQLERTWEDEILVLKLANAVANGDIFDRFMQDEFDWNFGNNSQSEHVVGNNAIEVGCIVDEGFADQAIEQTKPSSKIASSFLCFCYDSDARHTDRHEDASVHAIEAYDVHLSEVDYPAADMSPRTPRSDRSGEIPT